MGGMDGVNGLSKQNQYDESDIEHMKGLESLSTNQAINRIGNHAGLGDTHNIHGSDDTAAELIAKHQEHEQEKWIKELVSLIPKVGDDLEAAIDIREDMKDGKLGAAIKSGSKALIFDALDRAAEHAEKHAGSITWRKAAGAIFVFKLLELAGKMAESVAADGELGQERKEAVVKSAMHITVLGSLNGLPQDYINAERDRYKADIDANGLVEKMSRAMGRGDNNLMGVIQLHCDQGIAAARAMYDSKLTPGDWANAHPDTYRRLAQDPAFRAGFQGTMYAHEHGQYDQVLKALDARDVRYEAHHVAVRG